MSNRIAIIGGTGFETAIHDRLDSTKHIRQVDTNFGKASVSIFPGTGGEIVFLARHGVGHTVPPHKINHRANIAALHSLGVKRIFSTSAVGSLTTHLEPGQAAILDDFIDMRGGPPTTFFDHGPVTHTDFSEPFSTQLRSTLLESIDAACAPDCTPASIIHTSGTYLCLNGPRYETPAEVRIFGAMGAELVGMTVAPEAILSRELGLKYAGVSVITNYGTGIASSPLSHTEVEAMMLQMRPLVVELLMEACRREWERGE